MELTLMKSGARKVVSPHPGPAWRTAMPGPSKRASWVNFE